MQTFSFIQCLVASLQLLEDIEKHIPKKCIAEKRKLSQKITVYKAHLSRNFFEPLDILLRQIHFSDPWFDVFQQPLHVECEHLLHSVVVTMTNEFKRIGQHTRRNSTLRQHDTRHWRLAMAKRRLLSQFSRYADIVYSLQNATTTRLVQECFDDIETTYRHLFSDFLAARKHISL